MGALLKDESIIKSVMFLSCFELYWFSYEGKPYKFKYRFVTYAFQGPLLSSIVIFCIISLYLLNLSCF
jgi:hypothetical protein